jgi:hypothetical protein
MAANPETPRPIRDHDLNVVKTTPKRHKLGAALPLGQ